MAYRNELEAALLRVDELSKRERELLKAVDEARAASALRPLSWRKIAVTVAFTFVAYARDRDSRRTSPDHAAELVVARSAWRPRSSCRRASGGRAGAIPVALFTARPHLAIVPPIAGAISRFGRDLSFWWAPLSAAPCSSSCRRACRLERPRRVPFPSSEPAPRRVGGRGDTVSIVDTDVSSIYRLSIDWARGIPRPLTPTPLDGASHEVDPAPRRPLLDVPRRVRLRRSR